MSVTVGMNKMFSLVDGASRTVASAQWQLGVAAGLLCALVQAANAENTWSDEYNLTGSPLNQRTKSYAIEFNGVAPALQKPQPLSDGSFRFDFTNYARAYFAVVVTTNLALPSSNWTSLNSLTQTSAGHFQFTETAATNMPRRVCRLRPP